MSTIFDVAVMGGGPGGYVAALRAAQNGLSVVCIDDGVNAQGEPSPGGTCLNVGCIPSKSLLQSSELYAQVQHEASIHGVNVEGVSFNAAAMIQRKDAIVSRLTMGISLLFKKNKVKHLCGLATLERAQDEIWQLRVNDQHIHARNVVIATGSQPRQLPGVTIDNQQILDNRGALALSEVPPRLGVIGAGVIGLELGSVWNRVGSDVTLLEMAPTFLPALEARLSNEVRKAMIASGMKMQLAVEIEAIEQRDDGVHVRWRQGEKREESRFDKLILAIGRVPRLSGVDLVQLGLEADNRGGIAVDNLCRTGKAGLLELNGCDADIAQDVAEHMIEAERYGFASHGVTLLPKYLENIARGDVTANARPECLTSEGNLQRFHAHNGFGQHAGKVAVNAAIEQAKHRGFCLLTLCHAHHLGRMGHYGQMVADQGLAMLAMSNVTGRPALVAPWGGAEPRMTTNPFCFAWPFSDGRPPILVDFATSSMALNKARVMSSTGKQAAPGQLIDAQGNPSNDPGVLFSNPPGALLPFGEHKGFGLALMIEMMAGILSGGDTIAEDHQTDGSAHNHLFALIIDPDQFTDLAGEKGQFFADYLLATQPQPGGNPVIYPGMPEAANRERNAKMITIPVSFWSWIVEHYARKGIDLGLHPQESALAG